MAIETERTWNRRRRAATVRKLLVEVLLKKRRSKIGVGVLLAFVVLIIVAPRIFPYSPYASTGPPNSSPSWDHPLGTDFLGRDVLIDTVTGAYASVPIGILTATGAVLLGLAVGIFAGYYNRLEGLFTGVADVIMTFPPLPLLLLF